MNGKLNEYSFFFFLHEAVLPVSLKLFKPSAKVEKRIK